MRWFQFSLRGWFIVVTCLAVAPMLAYSAIGAYSRWRRRAEVRSYLDWCLAEDDPADGLNQLDIGLHFIHEQKKSNTSITTEEQSELLCEFKECRRVLLLRRELSQPIASTNPAQPSTEHTDD